MNTNFSLGNQRVAELKAQKNMYMSYLKKQQMIINALQHNAFRQHSSVPASAPAPVPAPAPPPAFAINKKDAATPVPVGTSIIDVVPAEPPTPEPVEPAPPVPIVIFKVSGKNIAGINKREIAPPPPPPPPPLALPVIPVNPPPPPPPAPIKVILTIDIPNGFDQ